MPTTIRITKHAPNRTPDTQPGCADVDGSRDSGNGVE